MPRGGHGRLCRQARRHGSSVRGASKMGAGERTRAGPDGALKHAAGSAWCITTPLRNSCFIPSHLPVNRGSAVLACALCCDILASRATEGGPSLSYSFGLMRLLIADDDTVYRMFLGRELSKLGFEVVTACDGEIGRAHV